MFRTYSNYRLGQSNVQGASKVRWIAWVPVILLISVTGPFSKNPLRAGDAASPADSRDAKQNPDRSSTRPESRVALKPSLNTRSTNSSALDTSDVKRREDSIARALRMISLSKARFREVDDYSCDFYKRERVHGKLTELHVMDMKERVRPKSIYFKFRQPNRGREAIYVDGKNEGLVVAHDVGFTKFLTGTMRLDPRGSRAMENNRHPITEAGIGELIDTIESRWTSELDPKHSIVNHVDGMQVGPHASVSMIESIHPSRRPEFLFHKVRLYINDEHGLPIRFEAYDWPKTPDVTPELVEEYTYLNLRLNVGLRDTDFDPSNGKYAFGHF
jgi:hypothetical protein